MGIIQMVLYPISSVLIRERQIYIEENKGVSVTTETEMGVMQPPVKDSRQPLQARQSKEHILP